MLYSSTNESTLSQSSSLSRLDIIIIGAGPYGLSLAAHFAQHDLTIAIFGKPMGFWRDCVHPGITLRSHWRATSLSDPTGQYSLARYLDQHQQTSAQLTQPRFVNYGLWFQQQAVPQVDETLVTRVHKQKGSQRFKVELADGRILTAPIVIVATGLQAYAWKPPLYQDFPDHLVSHTAQNIHYDTFTQKQIAVIGGGPSAVETASLIQAEAAHVDIITRRPILWVEPDETAKPKPYEHNTHHQRTLWQRLRYPDAKLSPGWFNWWLENFPYTFHSLPRYFQDELFRGKGGYRPANNGRLRDQMGEKVSYHENVEVCEAHLTGDQITLHLSNGKVQTYDHVLLGTGYQTDLGQLSLLSPELLNQIQTYQHAPLLSGSFESSVSGLYFVGLASVRSFGPLYRFVIGAEATASRITATIIRQRVKR